MKMVTVGVRELKQRASELIRIVRETGSEIQVTYHGEVVALLIPVKPVRKDVENAWAKLDHLAAEIGALAQRRFRRRCRSRDAALMFIVVDDSICGFHLCGSRSPARYSLDDAGR